MRLLDEERFDEALRIGRRLVEKHRFSGGFEVAGLAHAGLGDTAKAIEVFDAGVASAPASLILWKRRADLLDDAGRTEDALASYARADALAKLAAIEPGDAAMDRGRASLEGSLLIDLQRFDEAIALATRALQDDDERSATFLGLRARAAFEKGDHDGARRDALAAVYEDWSIDGAFVLRKLRGRTSPTARWFRIHVAASLQQEMNGKPAGTYELLRIFDVVAESPEEALEHARDFEPARRSKDLRVDSFEAGEPTPEELLGVHDARTGRIFYPAGS